MMPLKNCLKRKSKKDSAFQEIAQYLGGVLTKRESIENKLSDIDKIKQHGFDVKYGFRTRKKDK